MEVRIANYKYTEHVCLHSLKSLAKPVIYSEVSDKQAGWNKQAG